MTNIGAVVRVGEGRGFVVDGGRIGRLIITAAHCLPELPPAHGAAHTEERTYAELVGPLNGERTLWVECFFVDPISDLAVLGGPDNQVLFDEADAYEQFADAIEPFTPGAASVLPSIDDEEPHAGAVLSLAGEWIPCEVAGFGRSVWLRNVNIEAGMSGSPIVVDGAAVGVVGLGEESDHSTRRWMPQSSLEQQMPTWVLAAIMPARAAR